MMKSFLTIALSAGAITLGGAAFAQSGGAYGSGETNKGTTEKSMSQGMTEKPAMPTKDLVGKDIVNAKGETIGEVEAVEGSSIIVGVGGFLGIGQRNVAIDWDQVSLAGTGKDAKLQVNMSEEQLKALPEHETKSMGG